MLTGKKMIVRWWTPSWSPIIVFFFVFVWIVKNSNQNSVSNGVPQFGVFRNKKIIFFKWNLIFIYCMIKYKDTIIKHKDTIIINLHHQISSKYVQLNHFSNVDVYAYPEHHSKCQTYYWDSIISLRLRWVLKRSCHIVATLSFIRVQFSFCLKKGSYVELVWWRRLAVRIILSHASLTWKQLCKRRLDKAKKICKRRIQLTNNNQRTL